MTGFSLRAVIDAAAEGRNGIDNFSYGYGEISRPSGGNVVLSIDQIRDSEGFEDGPAVVYGSGGSTAFLRPSTGSGDENAPDNFSTSGSLEVRLRSGSPVAVEAQASATKVDAGDTVDFTATVTNAPSGTSPTLSWSFGDGASGSGSSVDHEFKKECVCNVIVSARIDARDTGASDVVRVEVGEPKKKGPNRNGGGEDKDRNAPGDGLTDGSGGTEGGTGSGSGTAGAGGTPAGGGSEAAQDRSAEDAPGGGERVAGELLSSRPVGPAGRVGCCGR